MAAEAAAVTQRGGRLNRQEAGGRYRRPLQEAGGRYKKRAAVAGGRCRNNALGQDAPTGAPARRAIYSAAITGRPACSYQLPVRTARYSSSGKLRGPGRRREGAGTLVPESNRVTIGRAVD